jgi:hypothetical protein
MQQPADLARDLGCLESQRHRSLTLLAWELRLKLLQRTRITGNRRSGLLEYPQPAQGGSILCELTVAGAADSCVFNNMESLAW